MLRKLSMLLPIALALPSCGTAEILKSDPCILDGKNRVAYCNGAKTDLVRLHKSIIIPEPEYLETQARLRR